MSDNAVGVDNCKLKCSDVSKIITTSANVKNICFYDCVIEINDTKFKLNKFLKSKTERITIANHGQIRQNDLKKNVQFVKEMAEEIGNNLQFKGSQIFLISSVCL